jgi:hypothetical protein
MGTSPTPKSTVPTTVIAAVSLVFVALVGALAFSFASPRRFDGRPVDAWLREVRGYYGNNGIEQCDVTRRLLAFPRETVVDELRRVLRQPPPQSSELGMLWDNLKARIWGDDVHLTPDLSTPPSNAAWVLGFMGESAAPAIPELVDALESAWDYTPEAAANALGRLRQQPDAVIPALGRLAMHPDSEKALAALHAIGSFESAAMPFRNRWDSALTHPDGWVRAATLETLVNAGAPAAELLPPLRTGLVDSDREVRAHAAHLLGRLGPEAQPTAPELAALLASHDPDVRLAAAQSLVLIEPAQREPALQVISTFLALPPPNSEYEDVLRTWVARTFFWKHLDRRYPLRDQIFSLLDAGDLDAAGDVVWIAVENFPDEDVRILKFVRRLLESSSGDHEVAAIWTLRELGPRAAAFLPQLESLSQSTNHHRASLARDLIWMVEHGEP